MVEFLVFIAGLAGIGWAIFLTARDWRDETVEVNYGPFLYGGTGLLIFASILAGSRTLTTIVGGPALLLLVIVMIVLVVNFITKTDERKSRPIPSLFKQAALISGAAVAITFMLPSSIGTASASGDKDFTSSIDLAMAGDTGEEGAKAMEACEAAYRTEFQRYHVSPSARKPIRNPDDSLSVSVTGTFYGEGKMLDGQYLSGSCTWSSGKIISQTPTDDSYRPQ